MIIYSVITLNVFALNAVITFASRKSSQTLKKLKPYIFVMAIVQLVFGLIAHVLAAGWLRLLIDGRGLSLRFLLALVPWLVAFWTQIGFMHYHGAVTMGVNLLRIRRILSSGSKYRYPYFLGKNIKYPYIRFDQRFYWFSLEHCYGLCQYSVIVHPVAFAFSIASCAMYIYLI